MTRRTLSCSSLYETLFSIFISFSKHWISNAESRKTFCNALKINVRVTLSLKLPVTPSGPEPQTELYQTRSSARPINHLNGIFLCSQMDVWGGFLLTLKALMFLLKSRHATNKTRCHFCKHFICIDFNNNVLDSTSTSEGFMWWRIIM